MAVTIMTWEVQSRAAVPDGYTPCQIQQEDGYRLIWAFNPSTPMWACVEGILPEGTVVTDLRLWIYYCCPTTTGTIDYEAAIEAVTPGDSYDMSTAGGSFDTASAVTETVPGTAEYLERAEIDLASVDGIQPGDYFRLLFGRDADDATNDTCTGDGRVYKVSLVDNAS